MRRLPIATQPVPASARVAVSSPIASQLLSEDSPARPAFPVFAGAGLPAPAGLVAVAVAVPPAGAVAVEVAVVVAVAVAVVVAVAVCAETSAESDAKAKTDMVTMATKIATRLVSWSVCTWYSQYLRLRPMDSQEPRAATPRTPRCHRE